MKIAVVGAGAMGSVYAGLLRAAGNDVWALDTWAEHVEAIARDGLRVSGASGDRVVRLHATTDPAAAGEAELVVIATKAYDVRAAAEAAMPLVGAGTLVLTIQNGLGSAEVVAEVHGEERLLVGVAGGWGASIPAPGHVHHHGLGSLRLGEPSRPVSDELDRVAAVWRAAGVPVRTDDDIDRLIWEKLVCNAAFSAPCALLELTIGEVLDDPSAWAAASACAREAYDVAVASGIRVPIDDPVRHVADFGATIRGARPSMLLDVLARRRCEIDAINGAIPPRARRLGLEAPWNEAVSALVRAKEAARLRPDRIPAPAAAEPAPT